TIPCARSLGFDCVEVPTGNLGGEILAGALDAYGRDSDFHEHGSGVLRGKSKECFQVRSSGLPETCSNQTILTDAETMERLRKLRHEIDDLIFGPARGSAKSFDVRVVNYAQIGIEDAVPVRQIQNHIAASGL